MIDLRNPNFLKRLSLFLLTSCIIGLLFYTNPSSVEDLNQIKQFGEVAAAEVLEGGEGMAGEGDGDGLDNIGKSSSEGSSSGDASGEAMEKAEAAKAEKADKEKEAVEKEAEEEKEEVESEISKIDKQIEGEEEGSMPGCAEPPFMYLPAWAESGSTTYVPGTDLMLTGYV